MDKVNDQLVAGSRAVLLAAEARLARIQALVSRDSGTGYGRACHFIELDEARRDVAARRRDLAWAEAQ